MRLTGKFLSAFLAIGLLPFLAISIISYSTSSSALEEQAFKQLKAVRDIKKTQVQDYFDTLIKELEITAEDSKVHESIGSFQASFTPQDPYKITSQWHALAKQYDAHFRSIQSKYGWYDLFLIDRFGRIVYTATREADLGQSIPKSAINDSGLGSLYAKLKASGSRSVHTADFLPYAPSNGDPAGFMMKRMNIKGVAYYIALQIPLDYVNKVMQERSGMGETGETYLVGPDKLMRSNSFLDPKNHSVLASFHNPELGSVKQRHLKHLV